MLQNDREGSEQIATDRLAVKITKQQNKALQNNIAVFALYEQYGLFLVNAKKKAF